VTGLMFYAFLVTCEAANALSRKGCRHFEAFDQGNENFDREVFQVKDVVLKRSAEALYDWVWGSYDRVVVKERVGRALEQAKAFFPVGVGSCVYICDLNALLFSCRRRLGTKRFWSSLAWRAPWPF
jgi:hypothetical protein